MTPKEKFAEFKKNFKQTAKDHAPELIIVGTTVIGFITYVAYVARSSAKDIASGESDVFVVDNTGDVGLILTAGTIGEMLEAPSKFCFKLDEDHHYSLAPNDCTEVH